MDQHTHWSELALLSLLLLTILVFAGITAWTQSKPKLTPVGVGSSVQPSSQVPVQRYDSSNWGQ